MHDSARKRATGAVSRGTRSLRRLATHEHIWACALLASLLLIYLWRAVVEGETLSAVSSLYGLAPWKSAAPADLSHFYNQLLIDQAKAHYPWDVFDRHALRSGKLPVWNPLVLSGTPYFANSQSGLTSLFNVPLWILPLNYALGLVAWVKLSFAAVGTYLLARELRLGFWPGMLAGISYSLCAFNVTWLGHQTLVATSVCLPWLVLATERVLRRCKPIDLLALALLSALAMNGGHPGTETHIMGGAALYLLVRAATMRSLSGRERFRRVGFSVGAITIGVLLMAVVLIPVIEASSGTAGRTLRAGGGPTLSGSVLKTALFPGWWGRPSEGNLGGPFNYVERTAYTGSVALTLAALGLLAPGGWRRKLPFAAIGLVGLGVAFGFPLLHAIVVHLPAFSSVDDSRITVLFEFAVAILSAFGLQAIIERPSGLGRRILLVLGAAAIASAIAVIALGPSLHDIRTAINHFRTGHDYPAPPILALTSIGWFTIFLLAVAVTLALMYRGPRIPRRAAAAVIVLIAAADMYHFAAGFQPIGPARQLVPPKTPAIAYLQRHTEGYRVFGISGALDVDYSMIFGLKDPSGYDPPQPSERYARIWQVANPAQPPGAEWLVGPDLSPAGLKTMNLFGVRYLIAAPNEPLPSSLPLRSVYANADATIYENEGAAAPAEVPTSIVFVADEQEDLDALTSPRFDVRRTAVVERDQPYASGVEAGVGTSVVTREVNAEVQMRAEMTRGGLVVLDDAWAPGWSVEVDGRAARPLLADDVMRGVIVPAGNHTITWHYRVRGLKLGIVLTAVSLFTILGFAAWIVYGRLGQTRARRAAPADGPMRSVRRID